MTKNFYCARFSFKFSTQNFLNLQYYYYHYCCCCCCYCCYFLQDNSPTHSNSPPQCMNGDMNMPPIKPAPIHPHSLPTTPTAVRTFQDFSQEHTRLLTTLHGSTGMLEVNGLGGFYSSVRNGNGNHHQMGGATQYNPQIDPIMNGYGKYNDQSDMMHRVPPPQQFGRSSSVGDDDLTDVLQGLSINGKEQARYATGYNRHSMMAPPMRRSSVPVQSGPMMGWPESIVEEPPPVFSPNPSVQQSKLMSGFNSLNPIWHPSSNQSNNLNPPPAASSSSQQTSSSGAGSIWSPTFSSRPESELSSYQDSDGGSANGFSPIYSPVSAVTSGFFEPFTVVSSSVVSSSNNQYTVQATSNATTTTTAQFVVSMHDHMCLLLINL